MADGAESLRLLSEEEKRDMEPHSPKECEGEEQRGARQERCEAEDEVFARASQLEMVFEAMTDGLFVFDTDGRILQMNQAARDLLGIGDLASYMALPLEERGRLTAQRAVPAQSPPFAAWATTRVLAGEVLTGMTAVEFTMRNRQGRELRINLSGAPIRDRHGEIIGAINICRDVTEHWQFEQRIQETVHALLAMAQILAQLPQDPRASQVQEGGKEVPAPAVAQAVGQRLADLTRSALDCRHVGLLACEQETGHLHPLAVVGFPPEEERQWVRTLGQCRLEDTLESALLARLQAGEVVRIDGRGDLLPREAREGLLAPMQRGPHLMGVLSLDYGETAHRFTLEEEALVSAVAKLATLGMERERFLREMAEACAREGTLRERTQRMDEFLGILAHELRTPLGNLRGFAQTLLVQTALGRGPKLSAWQEKALTGLDLVAARLDELIDDLLDMARLHAGQMKLSPEPTDLISLVQRVITRLQLTTTHHLLSYLPSVEYLVQEVDPRRIEQVVGNLLSNAIKYSPEGGLIEVTLAEEREQQETILTVRDQGIGIPPQQQEQIFQRFVQAENARASGIEGTGLGLYLCRALVERHGGRIWCESVEGQGATFFVALPSAGQHPSSHLSPGDSP